MKVVTYIWVVVAVGLICDTHEQEESVCKVVSPQNLASIGMAALKENIPSSPQCFLKSFLLGLFNDEGFDGLSMGDSIEKLKTMCQLGEIMSGLQEFLTCSLESTGDVGPIAGADCIVFIKAMKCVPQFAKSLAEFAKSLPELAKSAGR